jgi:peptide/nickel transport system permease protein
MAVRPETNPLDPAVTLADEPLVDEPIAGLDNIEAEEIYVAPDWKLVWWRFRKHRLALVSILFIAIIIVIALFPEFLSTQPPEEASANQAFIPPQPLHFFGGDGFTPFVYGLEGKRNSTTLRMEWVIDETKKIPLEFFVAGFEYKLLGLIPTNIHLLGLPPEQQAQGARIYLLGTDRLGRDQWSRLMYGTRISMSLGLIGVALSVFLGLLLGGLSGYLGGMVDTIIQRLIELLQSLPTIPLWLALTAALPQDWSVEQVYFAIVLILSLVTWSTLGREVRGRFLALREEDFIVAAKLVGAGQLRIIFKHMVPAFTSHIIATSTLAIPVMIINEASLSFLGLGLRPPAISWGVMLQEAQNLQSVALAPWLLFPGVAIILTVLGLNLVGDGLRDAADPYSP